MLSILPTRFNIAVTSIVLTCIILNIFCRLPHPEDDELPDIEEAPIDATVKAIELAIDPYTNDQSTYRVQNETLGFQDVYIVSLPSRTDKRDAFAMQAALSGITYTLMDGVDGRQVAEKALPYVRFIHHMSGGAS